VLDDAGLAVTRTEYLPFGETWFQEGDTKNEPKYNSHELDKESGFYFYNARHYDPEIARFVTPDTVIDGELSTQGWNRFAYVHNNPIRYKDPTGHWKVDKNDIVNYTDEKGSAHSSLLHSGTVTKGDTLWSISKKQLETEIGKKNVTNKLINSRVNAIKAVNGLKDSKIKPGKKLITGFQDKNFGKEALEAPPFDPIMDGAMILAGGGVGKKAAQESLSKIAADTIFNQGAKRLALRESGKLIEHSTSNLVKGLLKAADNKTRALAAKELYYKFGATKTAAGLAGAAEVFSGIAPSPPQTKKQATGAVIKELYDRFTGAK
jgi:RHS repeat-associated protein